MQSNATSDIFFEAQKRARAYGFLEYCTNTQLKSVVCTHLQSWHLSICAGSVQQIQRFVQLIVVENSKLGKVNQQEG